MNIAETRGKIKAILDRGLADWGVFAVVAAVGLVAFGLGRFSALEDIKPPVSLSQASGAESPQALYIGGLIVASRTGSVYYYPWCSGVSNIKEQNRVWFTSEQAAADAGYSPSKSCKGLSEQ